MNHGRLQSLVSPITLYSTSNPSKHTVQAIPLKHTVQAIPSKHTIQAILSKKKTGTEEKAVDKREIGGKETKEKDIMKRRQEGGEEEKKMGTEERERRRNR